MSNIFLIGYRGVGKSSVAARLAERLGWSWQDSDPLIEQAAGESIREIFAHRGETAFRNLETEVLRRLAAGEQTVVALGGGAVLREENRRMLAGRGLVVWLTASVDTIVARLAADPTTADRRPSLTATGGEAEIRSLLAQREPIYRACAHLEIDTENRSEDEIAAEIVQRGG